MFFFNLTTKQLAAASCPEKPQKTKKATEEVTARPER